MRITKDTFLLLLSVCLCVSCAHTREASKTLAGKWKLQSRKFGGIEQATHSTYLSFSANRFEVTADGIIVEAGRTTFDTISTPCKYDATVVHPKLGTTKQYFAIYKIEGDVLTACVNTSPGGARPTSFVSPPGTSIQLATWVRVK